MVGDVAIPPRELASILKSVAMLALYKQLLTRRQLKEREKAKGRDGRSLPPKPSQVANLANPLIGSCYVQVTRLAQLAITSLAHLAVGQALLPGSEERDRYVLLRAANALDAVAALEAEAEANRGGDRSGKSKAATIAQRLHSATKAVQ
eukprot:gene1423-32794_t